MQDQIKKEFKKFKDIELNLEYYKILRLFCEQNIDIEIIENLDIIDMIMIKFD